MKNVTFKKGCMEDQMLLIHIIYILQLLCVIQLGYYFIATIFNSIRYMYLNYEINLRMILISAINFDIFLEIIGRVSDLHILQYAGDNASVAFYLKCHRCRMWFYLI